MNTNFKYVLTGLLVVAVSSSFLTGCNTVRGVGKDIQAVATPDNSTSSETTVKTTRVVSTPD